MLGQNIGRVGLPDMSAGGRPSLTLDFVGIPVLNERITFSRTSGATWFSPDGVLKGVDFSTSSVTIGTGSKSFTLDATAGVNRYWAVGDLVRVSQQSNSANFMEGTVTSYTASSQVLVIDVTSTGGSGTIASWRVASHMPRFDYNPSTLEARGLLIEESRTNSIRNNTMQGAVAGTPGTLPTNWNVGSASGLTTNVVGTGTEAGVNYVDIQFVGTPTATAYTLFFDAQSQIAAANGQTWASSLWCRIVAGTTTNITSVNNNITFRDSGAVSLESLRTAMGVSSTLTRYSQARTATNASTAFVQPGLWLTITVGAAIDITLRIGLPQLENNNISTGVASATVAAGGSGYAVGDVLQIVGGTGSTAARLTVATLSGSAVATVTVSTAGSYSVFPSPQPVSVTAITGTGSSATFNIVPQTQTGFATSVIPTTTTALTRSADAASVNTLSPWFNSTAGTIYAEFSIPASTASRSQATFGDGTANERMIISNNTSLTGTAWRIVDGGVDQADINNSTSFANNATVKVAGAYAANDFATCQGGGTVGTDTSGTLPTVTALYLGSNGAAQYASSHLRRITYYPRKLSSAELQAITA